MGNMLTMGNWWIEGMEKIWFHCVIWNPFSHWCSCSLYPSKWHWHEQYRHKHQKWMHTLIKSKWSRCKKEYSSSKIQDIHFSVWYCSNEAAKMTANASHKLSKSTFWSIYQSKPYSQKCLIHTSATKSYEAKPHSKGRDSRKSSHATNNVLGSWGR